MPLLALPIKCAIYKRIAKRKDLPIYQERSFLYLVIKEGYRHPQ